MDESLFRWAQKLKTIPSTEWSSRECHQEDRGIKGSALYACLGATQFTLKKETGAVTDYTLEVKILGKEAQRFNGWDVKGLYEEAYKMIS